jgi:hypothetical protein
VSVTARLVVAAVLLTSGSGCAFLRGIDKVSKTPGLEEAQLVQPLKEKHPGRSRPNDDLSPLQADPPVLDFGQVPVASRTRRVVVISNPASFVMSVVRVTVQGCGFALDKQLDQHVIPAHGDLVLTLAFRPVETGFCAGELLLESDSAVGRFTPVVLKGRGI